MRGAMQTLAAGSVWSEPGNQPHYVWVKDEPVVIQIIGYGPTENDTGRSVSTKAEENTAVEAAAWRPQFSGGVWLLRFGLGITILWVILGLTYIFGSLGWRQFAGLTPDELGGFLEGSFAPLAFLWLVIGYFLQREELRQNTDALRAQAKEIQLSVEQLMIQSDKMAQTEIHSRQRTFLQVVERVYMQLGTIAGLLYTSSQGITGSGHITQEEIGEMFAKLSNRDTEVFSRQLLEATFRMDSDEDCYELFYGTDIRARHSNHFIRTFERMLARATEVDEDTMIRDAVGASTHAFLYHRAKRYQAMAPDELADYRKTGISIQL